jgi:hypothetical protein
MIKRVLAVLVATLFSGSVIAAEGDKPTDDKLRACSDEAEKTEALPPGPDDTHDRNGKPLSQTPGAKRTRALKRQAAKDAITLECIKRSQPVTVR